MKDSYSLDNNASTFADGIGATSKLCEDYLVMILDGSNYVYLCW